MTDNNPMLEQKKKTNLSKGHYMENRKNNLLKTGQMARCLGVPARWLREEAEAGRIPALKADNIFLFDPETVTRILTERAQKGAGNE